jgi:hypothetical protein
MNPDRCTRSPRAVDLGHGRSRYDQGVLMTIVISPHLPAYDYRAGDGPKLVFLHYWGGAARTCQHPPTSA